MGGEVAFVDAEHALDPVYAKAIGVDIDSMLVSQPDTGDQALEITDALVRSGAVEKVCPCSHPESSISQTASSARGPVMRTGLPGKPDSAAKPGSCAPPARRSITPRSR